jgi:hypothetical protein
MGVGVLRRMTNRGNIICTLATIKIEYVYAAVLLKTGNGPQMFFLFTSVFLYGWQQTLLG